MNKAMQIAIGSLYQSPEGGTGGADTTAKATRARQFGRVYDHAAGTLTITSAFDKDYKKVIELSKIPENVLRGFALQGIGDYVTQEAAETLRDEDIKDEAERRAASLKTLDEAEAELVEGKVDFREGVGLGGMRSAIGALGAVLFELGKTYVMNAKGEKLSFNDLNGARAAVKALYLDTDEVQKPHPQGGTDKDGKPRTVTITSRMFFNAIQKDAKVAEALAAKRKVKAKPQFGDVMG